VPEFVQKLTVLSLLTVAAYAADTFPPTAEEKRQIGSKISTLSSRVKALSAKHADSALVADVDLLARQQRLDRWCLPSPQDRERRGADTATFYANLLATYHRLRAAEPTLTASHLDHFLTLAARMSEAISKEHRTRCPAVTLR
jgi:hypothetical protein